MAEEATASGIPKWVWIAAIIGVVLVLFLAKNKASAGTAASIQAAPLDPNAVALAQTQSAASLGAYQALVSGVTAIDTNANTNAAGLATTQSNGATLRGLGTLQLKATQSNNATSISIAQIQAQTAQKKSSNGTIGTIITGIVGILALL